MQTPADILKGDIRQHMKSHPVAESRLHLLDFFPDFESGRGSVAYNEYLPGAGMQAQRQIERVEDFRFLADTQQTFATRQPGPVEKIDATEYRRGRTEQFIARLQQKIERGIVRSQDQIEKAGRIFQLQDTARMALHFLRMAPFGIHVFGIDTIAPAVGPKHLVDGAGDIVAPAVSVMVRIQVQNILPGGPGDGGRNPDYIQKTTGKQTSKEQYTSQRRAKVWGEIAEHKSFPDHMNKL
jgi:hypothetical protein